MSFTFTSLLLIAISCVQREASFKDVRMHVLAVAGVSAYSVVVVSRSPKHLFRSHITKVIKLKPQTDFLRLCGALMNQ